MTGEKKETKKSFLLLPLDFFVQSSSDASADSLAAALVSGSPAGRSPSHVLGPQLAPGERKADG